MSEKLKEDNEITLAICAPGGKDKDFKKAEYGGITYYLLPCDCFKNNRWDGILDDFRPDVIHAYGSEMPHNYLLAKNCGDIPLLVSLQGILTQYQRHYYGGIDVSEIIRYTTIRDILKRDGVLAGRKSFRRMAEHERKLLSLAKFAEGRSTWDKVSALDINPGLQYFYCPRMIRLPFYNKIWSVEKIKRHSIFVHQGNYPIKGLHFVLEALKKLKQKYPDAMLYVAGNDIFTPKSFKNKLFPSGYVKYLNTLIDKYGLRENITFTGFLDAEKLSSFLLEMNAVVIPSSIENAPNSLAEAMLEGVPCVASFVGGNMDMLKHGEEGFLYCYNEPNMLAEYLTRIFESDGLASFFSDKARSASLLRHDREKLKSTLVGIYKSVIDSSRGASKSEEAKVL
ncbi:MAG: glycosyltransferase family 4 protein [Clostridiales bacterium]|nr:glycosyltransferase family 4 protein [Clostridiales bacterium]